jgi:hypothetical protein
MRVEEKTTNWMIKRLKKGFREEMDDNAYIDGLWRRIGGKLRSKGINQRDIDKAIKKVRESRR